MKKIIILVMVICFLVGCSYGFAKDNSKTVILSIGDEFTVKVGSGFNSYDQNIIFNGEVYDSYVFGRCEVHNVTYFWIPTRQKEFKMKLNIDKYLKLKIIKESFSYPTKITIQYKVVSK